MTALAASGLTVRRGGRAILSDVHLRLEPGHLVALIGPNGAGKSTLLRTLAGLLRPDAGRVELDGRDLAGWEPRALARTRAYLPQNPRVDWPLAVERLVALGLTPSLPPFGGLPAAMAERVHAALAACDLVDRAAQPADTLSGGELTRAMLARALVGDPAVLIADEPTAGLDPRHALDVMRRLRGLARDEGRLVIVSLHDLTLAVRFADRILALRDGRTAADGPAANVLTSELLAEVFQVRAQIIPTADGALVDLAGLSA